MRDMKKSLIIVLIFIVMLLVVSCKKQQSPYLPDLTDLAPPEMKWDVNVDFSVLTPYIPDIKYSRLHEGAMPELLPSGEYGVLLPYATVNALENGDYNIGKYGLVTIDGVVVTDLIYNNIERANYRVWFSVVYCPAYTLSVWSSEPEEGFLPSQKKAACALDGSWITPFDYVEIGFTEDVIILMRDVETFDIDVYDYNGKFLYNMLEFEWTNHVPEDTWIGGLLYNVSNGYRWLPASSQYGNLLKIDMLTGEAEFLEYNYVGNFNEGLAQVRINNPGFVRYSELWGYINTEFDVVIEPEFTSAFEFKNGQALVCEQDNKWSVINTQGEILFSFPEGWYASPHFYGIGYYAAPINGNQNPIYYTNDFIEITLPDKVLALLQYGYFHELEGGWFAYYIDMTGAGVFKDNEDYFYPGVDHISYFDEKYVISHKYSEEESLTNVMTISGAEIMPFTDGVNVAATPGSDGVSAFMVNNARYHFYSYGIEVDYRPRTYKLISSDGDIIKTGDGVIAYDEAVGLCYIYSPEFFSWMDLEGNTIIKIPLMSYMLD